MTDLHEGRSVTRLQKVAMLMSAGIQSHIEFDLHVHPIGSNAANFTRHVALTTSVWHYIILKLGKKYRRIRRILFGALSWFVHSYSICFYTL